MTAQAYPTSPCAACNAPIIWCLSERRLKPQPIDLEPTPGANIRIVKRDSDGRLLAVVVGKHLAFGRTDLRRPHHATCPYASYYRRRNGRES